MAPYATRSEVQQLVDELESRIRPLIAQMQGIAPQKVGTVAVPFGAGFSAFGGGEVDPGFWRRGDVVFLEGSLLGPIGSPAFTLPPNFRPAGRLWFPIVSNGALGYLDITAAGVVTPQAGVNGGQRLNGISFRAAS